MKRNQEKISFILSNKNRCILLNKIFSYGLFILALLALLVFTDCNSTPTTPPADEEKLVIDLNTPDVEASIVADGNVTFLELAKYYDKLKNMSLSDSIVNFGGIDFYNIKDCAEEIGLDSFLGFYTKEQVRQSIKNGYPGITLQHGTLGQESYI